MKKEKYLAAIIPVLKEDGLNQSMETIAERIGVTKKTLYNRFISKEQMVEECLEVISQQFRESLSCMDDDSIPITDRFKIGITTLRHYFKDMSHAFLRDLIDLYPQKALLDHSCGSSYFEEKIRKNIEKGRDEGVYRPDIDPALFGRYITFSIFSFFQKEVMMGNEYSTDYYFNQVINYNINALLIKQQ